MRLSLSSWCAAVAVLLAAACARDVDLPPEPVPVIVGPLCTDDSQCPIGICNEDGLCDEDRCRVNDDCLNKHCRADGRCAVRGCEQDSDCALENFCKEQSNGDSLCHPGCVTQDHCPAEKTCRVTESLGYGSCIVGNCSLDSDCGPCGKCDYDINTGAGNCSALPRGPTLQGDPTALKMTDNLSAAVTFARQREPTAALIQINGAGLKSDGTVDITKSGDYVARWMYGFQVGDGVSAPPKFLTVTYLLQGGTVCGLYDGDAGNLSERPFIPDTAWQSYQDASALVAAFTAQSGCVAPAQTSSDYIIYDHDGTPPRFLVGNWKSQNAIGDPVNATFSYVSCQ